MLKLFNFIGMQSTAVCVIVMLLSSLFAVANGKMLEIFVPLLAVSAASTAWFTREWWRT